MDIQTDVPVTEVLVVELLLMHLVDMDREFKQLNQVIVVHTDLVILVDKLQMVTHQKVVAEVAQERLVNKVILQEHYLMLHLDQLLQVVVV